MRNDFRQINREMQMDGQIDEERENESERERENEREREREILTTKRQRRNIDNIQRMQK